jgi:molybdopterin synthase sulfur carrier subunit
MTELRIPTPLRQYTDGVKQIDVQADTVGQAVEHLAQTYPALRTHLFSEAGELRAFVNLFLNDEDVRFLQGKDTPLKDGDKLMIVPSIAGGVE